MMKHLQPTLALVFGLGSALVASAQIPGPPGMVSSATYYQSTAPIAQGLVTRYLMNPRGDVDGLLLDDGTQVKFPPHMSAELTATVKPGQTVTVQGFRENRISVKAFVISTGNASVVEHEPTSPPIPPMIANAQLTQISASGQVQRLLYGPRGDVNGVLLSDGSIVRFPPEAAYQLSALLQVGQTVSATGYGTQNQYGRALEATALGASGQALQPIYGPGTARVGPRG
jgi:hypothetical protein